MKICSSHEKSNLSFCAKKCSEMATNVQADYMDTEKICTRREKRNERFGCNQRKNGSYRKRKTQNTNTDDKQNGCKSEAELKYPCLNTNYKLFHKMKNYWVIWIKSF